jgi:hypothetical protein
MRKNLLSKKTPHNNKFKQIKLDMKKQRKFWLSMNVFDSMIIHIQNAKSPKQAWDTLMKMYKTNT